MKSLLVQHAINNIWCEPIQDRQHFVEPARLTSDSGSFKYTRVLWETIPLPNARNDSDKSYFHVYQLGQLKEQTFFAQVLEKDRWINVNDLCESYGLAIDIYLGNGVVIPRGYCFLRFNRDENILLSIRVVHTLDLGKESIYDPLSGNSYLRKVSLANNVVRVRFYKNARYQSIDWRNTAADTIFPIRSRSMILNNQGTYTSFMLNCASIENRYNDSGMGYWFLDGYLVNKPTGWRTDYVGKMLTFVWDSSIKGKFNFSLSNIPVFTSAINNKTKYILLLNSNYNTIDYQDDHDVYVTVTNSNGEYKGLYIDRMGGNVVTMLTHNCYALDTDMVNRLLSNHEDFRYIDKCNIQLIARQGGIYRGLTITNNRIEELYKLPRQKVIESLTGVQSSLPEWSARELEISPYVKIMSADINEIDDELVEAAYGYNAATLHISPVYHPTVDQNGQCFVKVPDTLLLRNPRTNVCERVAFGYKDGLFKRALEDKSNNDHIVLSTNGNDFDSVELFHGSLSDGLITYYDYETTTPDDIVNPELKHWEFRVYACGRNDHDQMSYDWRDITELDYHTYLEEGDVASNGVPCIRWDVAKLTQANIVPRVKILNTINIYKPFPDTEIEEFPGYITFLLTYRKDPISNTRSRMDLAPGIIDIFMNGVALIPEVDFFVEFPRIVITKEYTNLEHGSQIEVRYYGACDPVTMKPYKVRDHGFVKDGILSVDGEYDTRYDRNIRVNVGGYVVAKDRYVFAEDRAGNRAPDGVPWVVTDYMVQTESFTTRKTREYAAASRDLDDRVERYLTHHLGELAAPRPIIIDTRWRLYSPFCSAVIWLMKHENYPSDLIINGVYDTEKINQWLSTWLFLLDFDPALKKIDMNYIEVSPHPYEGVIEVSSSQYALLRYIINAYLDNNVTLSRFLIINN